MHEAEQLLRGVLDDPGDAQRRLVLADWLEEQGGSPNAARAELLRLQVQWEKARAKAARRKLEARAGGLVNALAGPLARLPRTTFPPLGTGLSLVLFACAEVVPPAQDRLDERSVWRGELRQGAHAHPTVWDVRERRGNSFKGDMTQDFSAQFGFRAEGQFWFEGVTVCGRQVVFVTGRREGLAAGPGVYLAKLAGDELAGEWRLSYSDPGGTFRLRRSRNRRRA
jgi:uncharacterized protein (TIGR02996 family)